MLVPAVVYKDQIEKLSDELRYSEQMMFYNGCNEHGRMQISIDPTEGRYQWAIVDKDKQLVGYLGYMVDYFSAGVYGFGLMNFTENKTQEMASGVLQAIRHILSMHPHRVEWRCVGDNPAFPKYRKICESIKTYQFHYSCMHDVFKDAYGKYHDCGIFELIKKDI